MRVGVVGVGRIGTFHAEVLAAHPAVTGLVLCDAEVGRARAVAARLGATTAPTVADLAAAVDAVVIASPTPAHAEHVATVAAAGRPVLCEKPLALDLAGTDAALAAAAGAGIPLQVGFQRRFDAGFLAARELVRSGALGRLYVVRLAGHDVVPPPEGFIAHSGGMFADMHIHDFDCARFVLGQEVVEVYADGAVLVEEYFATYGDVDTSVAVLRLSGGTLAILSGTRHDPVGYDVRMELFGSADSVTVGWNGRMPLRSVEPGVPAPPGPAYRDFMDRFGPAYRAEIDAILRMVREGTESPCPGEEARAALRIALAADRSRALRRPVAVEDIT